MSTDYATPRSKFRRIARACENCRKKKARCNGESPCSLCSRFDEICDYRDKPRIRHSRRTYGAASGLGSAKTSRHGGQADESRHWRVDTSGLNAPREPFPETPGGDVYQGVNASRPHSQMYYGPSSNFAFLQHVHQSFMDHARMSNLGGSDFTASLDIFKQLLFGLNEEWPKPDTTSRGRLLLLPQALAQRFLDNFLASIHHLTFWIDPTELKVAFREMLEHGAPQSGPCIDRAILLLSLAMGATVTEHDDWAATLHESANEEVAGLRQVVNLESVQILLLKAHYQLIYGRPNSAYLQLGEACRQAFAAGMHRDIEYENGTTHHANSEKRRATLWSLVFFERWVSFWLGRPSCVASVAISAPLPQQAPVVKTLAELSSIVGETAREIYDEHPSSLSKLWESAQRIQAKLRDFQRRTEGTFGFLLDGSLKGPPVEIPQVFIMNFFCHVWMITFRPFLIILRAWERRHTLNAQEIVSSETTELPIDLWWLPEACQIAVEFAHKLIHLFSEAAKQSDLVKGLAFSTAFLESACCLLFYDAMRIRSRVEAHIKSLQKALDCLNSMFAKGPMPAFMHTVQQLLNEVRRVQQTETTVIEARQTRNSVNNEPGDGHDPGQQLQYQQQQRHDNETERPSENNQNEIVFMACDSGFNLSEFGLENSIFAPDLDDYFNFTP